MNSDAQMRAFNAEHADKFREARIIIKNEFGGLNENEQYLNSFSRLLKWDPLGRVFMLGTDQRDQFIPLIKRHIFENVTRPGTMLDIGCGDGQTFSLISKDIPAGSIVDAIDPNPEYVSQFAKFLDSEAHLRAGQCRVGAFGVPSPLKDEDFRRGYGLITAIHVIYFFDDLEECLINIYDRLADDGIAIIVFADEMAAYTGISVRAYLDSTGDISGKALHEKTCRSRLNLFLEDDRKSIYIQDLLNKKFGKFVCHVSVDYQNTRIYGHTIADIIAACNITGLAKFGGPAKFEVAADIVEYTPETIDFRVELDHQSARNGMFSVSQPQIVAAIKKSPRSR